MNHSIPGGMQMQPVSYSTRTPCPPDCPVCNRILEPDLQSHYPHEAWAPPPPPPPPPVDYAVLRPPPPPPEGYYRLSVPGVPEFQDIYTHQRYNYGPAAPVPHFQSINPEDSLLAAVLLRRDPVPQPKAQLPTENQRKSRGKSSTASASSNIDEETKKRGRRKETRQLQGQIPSTSAAAAQPPHEYYRLPKYCCNVQMMTCAMCSVQYCRSWQIMFPQDAGGAINAQKYCRPCYLKRKGIVTDEEKAKQIMKCYRDWQKQELHSYQEGKSSSSFLAYYINKMNGGRKRQTLDHEEYHARQGLACSAVASQDPNANCCQPMGIPVNQRNMFQHQTGIDQISTAGVDMEVDNDQVIDYSMYRNANPGYAVAQRNEHPISSEQESIFRYQANQEFVSQDELGQYLMNQEGVEIMDSMNPELLLPQANISEGENPAPPGSASVPPRMTKEGNNVGRNHATRPAETTCVLDTTNSVYDWRTNIPDDVVQFLRWNKMIDEKNRLTIPHAVIVTITLSVLHDREALVRVPKTVKMMDSDLFPHVEKLTSALTWNKILCAGNCTSSTAEKNRAMQEYCATSFRAMMPPNAQLKYITLDGKDCKVTQNPNCNQLGVIPPVNSTDPRNPKVGVTVSEPREESQGSRVPCATEAICANWCGGFCKP